MRPLGEGFKGLERGVHDSLLLHLREWEGGDAPPTCLRRRKSPRH